MSKSALVDMPTRWWHRIELPDGSYTPGEVHHGPDGGDWPTTRFGLPPTMTGLRVLDVGAWDGFFSFEAEKRGALKVVATDVHTDISRASGGNWGGTTGFRAAKKLLGSQVDWRKLDITKFADVDAIIKEYGTFDVVLCYGVLYHVETPQAIVRALVNLQRLGKTLLIETAGASNRSNIPELEYRPGFSNDPTNYYYPNPAFIQQVLGTCVIIHDMGSRFTVKYEG